MSYVLLILASDGIYTQPETKAHETTSVFACQLAVAATVRTDAKINFTCGPWRGRFNVLTGSYLSQGGYIPTDTLRPTGSKLHVICCYVS
jgi:hypothetical protein